MANEVIKVQTTERGEQRVSARDLHKALEVKTRFSLWTEQNFKMFDDGADFTSVVSTTVVNNGATRQLDDYMMTIDMAKHIAMMSGTPKGHDIRNYFIQVEKQWNSPELMMARSLEYANKQLLGYESQIAVMKPKVEMHDKFIATGKAISIREAAKEMDVRQTTFIDDLLNHHYLYRAGHRGKLQPYAQYVGKWFVLKSVVINGSALDVTPQTLITPKGREHFYKLFYAPDQIELNV
ncbi:oxidoreductase [Weissella soli]|uniref:phage antirepressor KilAC domain-containing protein n=1 Tax=Weissella soli TaxID=155866 RepID=UPI0021BFA1BA|nr:phage antirepressor KilAC domain-containing protein [Weissella soli]MCT8395264.1 oxidoreductase [Weissella soli]